MRAWWRRTGKPPAPGRHLEEYAQGTCDGVADCYRARAAWAVVSGRLAVPIGRATDARYENGTAPPAVQECLVAAGKGRRIAPFDGHPGLLTCDYAGSLLTAERMDYSPDFVPSQ